MQDLQISSLLHTRQEEFQVRFNGIYIYTLHQQPSVVARIHKHFIHLYKKNTSFLQVTSNNDMLYDFTNVACERVMKSGAVEI
jgi:hypothetical protein